MNTSTISLLSSWKIKFLQKPTSAYGALTLNPVLLLPIQISPSELPPILSQVFVFHSAPEENEVGNNRHKKRHIIRSVSFNIGNLFQMTVKKVPNDMSMI